MGVNQLAYIGIEATDLAPWRDVLVNIIGMELKSDATNEVDLYRMDGRAYRVFVTKGDKDGLHVSGWQTGSLEHLNNISASLENAGVKVTVGDQALCDQRKARDVRQFTDPDGYLHELVYGQAEDPAEFHPGRNISGFVTGDQGLGHVVYHYSDHEGAVEFFKKHLRFRVSDYIVWADADAAFLRCNRRHHSLAIINEALGMKKGDVNHFQVQLESLADVGTAYDMVRERGFPIIMELGEHSNDRMVSFYFVTPGGFGLEVGCNALTVEDEEAWSVVTYDATMVWGHQMNGP